MAPAQPNDQEADDNHHDAKHHEQHDMIGTGKWQRVAGRTGSDPTHAARGDDRAHQGAPATRTT
jgi:hypothetical protein